MEDDTTPGKNKINKEVLFSEFVGRRLKLQNHGYLFSCQLGGKDLRSSVLTVSVHSHLRSETSCCVVLRAKSSIKITKKEREFTMGHTQKIYCY